MLDFRLRIKMAKDHETELKPYLNFPQKNLPYNSEQRAEYDLQPGL